MVTVAQLTSASCSCNNKKSKTPSLQLGVLVYKIDCIFLLAIKASITEKIWFLSVSSNLDTSKIRITLCVPLNNLSISGLNQKNI